MYSGVHPEDVHGKQRGSKEEQRPRGKNVPEMIPGQHRVQHGPDGEREGRGADSKATRTLELFSL